MLCKPADRIFERNRLRMNESLNKIIGGHNYFKR